MVSNVTEKINRKVDKIASFESIKTSKKIQNVRTADVNNES